MKSVFEYKFKIVCVRLYTHTHIFMSNNRCAFILQKMNALETFSTFAFVCTCTHVCNSHFRNCNPDLAANIIAKTIEKVERVYRIFAVLYFKILYYRNSYFIII